MQQVKSVAIIGAGCSGLAAAHTLCDNGYHVTLFEKSLDVGGRATTHKRAGFTYDDGAQYIKYGTPESMALVTERFRSPDLIDIQKPVWIFNQARQIQEGDPQQNAEPKWSYRSGLITLARQMAQGLDIQLATPITLLQQTDQGWQLFTEHGPHPDYFTNVLITIPASQALELLRVSQPSSAIQPTIYEYLSTARYNPLISVALGYHPRPQVRPYYALVNTDKAHPISWLAWEHEKAPERVPADTGLLIAQMAPQYSQNHWQTPDSDIAQDVAELVADLIDESLPAPMFTDITRWRYALPSAKADASTLNKLTLPTGLAFCGDAFVGGRIYLALEHGMTVAKQLIL
jgi:predicted NAD/FAD-dependent oxidoreductase